MSSYDDVLSADASTKGHSDVLATSCFSNHVLAIGLSQPPRTLGPQDVKCEGFKLEAASFSVGGMHKETSWDPNRCIGNVVTTHPKSQPFA